MARVDLDWDGDEIERIVNEAAGRGLRRGLDAIQETSQDRVLHRTGDLKRSSYTQDNGLSGVVGSTDNKAVGAHENLAVTPSKKRNPNARAKFLESALDDNADDVLRGIATEIRSVL